MKNSTHLSQPHASLSAVSRSSWRAWLLRVALLSALVGLWLPSACYIDITVQCNDQLACAAGFICENSRCRCPTGTQECGKDTNNLFCGDLANDPKNCGACGKVCPNQGACVNGQCKECDTQSGKFVICQDSGVCADLQVDNNNCGKCGNKCKDGRTCSKGQCACNDGKVDCGGTCVDKSNDPKHCGACSNECTDAKGGKFCNGGKCVAKCDDKCEGRCVDFQTDKNNCGKCGNKCSTGEDCCAGKCIDVTKDDKNCSRCGQACSGDQKCEASQCKCTGGKTSCGQNCVDLTTSSKHCGSCNNTCSSNEACTSDGGKDMKCCAKGAKICGGNCTPVQTDPNNCGDCGKSCNGQACVAGKCTKCTDDKNCPSGLTCDKGSGRCVCGPKCGWLATAGGKGADIESGGIAMDSNQNTYVVGALSGKATFGKFEADAKGGAKDLFVAKIDPSGNFLWVTVVGGAGSEQGAGIVVDSKGQAYIIGVLNGEASFTTANGQIQLKSEKRDILVAALDPNGRFIWAKKAGGPGDDYGRAIAFDGKDKLYITGRASKGKVGFGKAGTVDITNNSDMFVAQLDTKGEFQWQYNVGGKSAGNGIAVKQGKVFATGSFQGTITLPSNKNISSSGNDLMVLQFGDQGGLPKLGFTAQGSSAGNSIAIAADGTLRIVGYVGDGTVLGTDSYSFPATKDPGKFTEALGLALTSSLGYTGINYPSSFGDAEALGVGFVGTKTYVTGLSTGDVVLEKKLATLKGLGDEDVLIAATDALGNFTWGLVAGGSKKDRATGLAATNAGGVVVVGQFQDKANFPVGANKKAATAQGSTDLFIWKPVLP